MVIDFNDEQTWPPDVLDYLAQNHDLFLAWEDRTRPSPSVSGQQYDKALRGLRAILDRHHLHGYHCARLTRAEIDHIISQGMQLPNAAMLRARIEALQYEALIDASVAKRLIEDNQADEPNRANKIWFCFFPPRMAGQGGLECLLGFWGGEALYNTHEGDPITGPVLAKLGVPCLVEADIAVSSLRESSSLDLKAARQFLVWRGFQSSELLEPADYTTRDVPAANIRRVIEFPEPDFIALTGCETWEPPLK
jgi:hypothetical protein